MRVPSCRGASLDIYRCTPLCYLMLHSLNRLYLMKAGFESQERSLWAF